MHKERSGVINSATLLVTCAFVVVIESMITSYFIQLFLSRWGYDTFWSRGLLVVGASCTVSFLSLWLFLSVASSRLSGRSLTQQLVRHSVVFLPLSLLVLYPLIPEYNRQNVAVPLLATALGLAGILSLFLLYESWVQRDEGWPGRIFNVPALALFVCLAAAILGSVKFHDRYLLRLLDSEITHASLELTDGSNDRISLALRVAKVPGTHSMTTKVPDGGVLQCAALPNADFIAADLHIPISYRVEIAAEDSQERVLAEGEIDPGKISWVRRDLSSLAGKNVTITFQMEEPVSIGSLASRWHTLFRPYLWAPAVRTGTKARIMSAYWSEPVLYGARRKEDVNVLLIVVDALRADHLGCYGYNLDTTPTIDELARDGVAFREAISQSPWTLPSVASIYTGRLPSSHLAGLKADPSSNPAKLSPQPNYISLLKESGFYTIGFVNNPNLSPDFGMFLGFKEYYTNYGYERDSSEFACRWFESNADKKFFCLLHYIHPHKPYSPREGFVFENQERDRFGFKYSESQLKILAQYDSEIAYTDKKIRTVLDKLKELELLENTLVILTSDHGEEFYEHGDAFHGHSFYDELLRVPLIFYLPSRLPTGKTVRRQVRLMDILPTTLDILGIDSGEESVGGKSLLPLISAADKKDTPPAISEFRVIGSPHQKSIRYQGYKLIHDPNTGETELYDISTDPGERVDLSKMKPELYEDLVRRLRESTEENQSRYVRKAEPASPTEETKKALRALGYLD